jgi:hypothetical protein
MHPAVERQSVLNPSIAIQIPTLLCESEKREKNSRFSTITSFPDALAYLNTENTRAILPIARILFLMTSLRKLAALPARRVKKGGREKKLINFQVLQINCARSTSKESGKCV